MTDLLISGARAGGFPLLWIIDEVGAGYSEKLGELATQIRSLGYCLLLAGQEVQRLKTAAGDAMWTLIANMGVRITGKIMVPKDTLEILQLMAGTEYRAYMSAMMQQGSILGSGLSDDPRILVSEKKKVDVEGVQALQEGENVTLFRGQVVRGSSLYISDADKFTKEAVRINRFLEVNPPSEAGLLATMPFRLRRSYVCRPRAAHSAGARRAGRKAEHQPAGADRPAFGRGAFCGAVADGEGRPTRALARL